MNAENIQIALLVLNSILLFLLLRETRAASRRARFGFGPGPGPGEAEYVIGFGPIQIPAGETKIFKAQLKDDFSGTRLIVPSMLANDFSVNDIRVGGDSQALSGNPIPAAAFSELAVGVNLGLKKAKKGDDLELHVSNTTKDMKTFSAALIGFAKSAGGSRAISAPPGSMPPAEAPAATPAPAAQ
jgi:hypothetical protein